MKGRAGFPGGAGGKELACHAGDGRDVGSIPGLGRSPGEGMATHSSIPALEIPWTEKPGGMQSSGLQRLRHDRSSLACTHAKGRALMKT